MVRSHSHQKGPSNRVESCFRKSWIVSSAREIYTNLYRFPNSQRPKAVTEIREKELISNIFFNPWGLDPYNPFIISIPNTLKSIGT